MQTIILKENEEDIIKAAEIIKNGGIVAFPTETVYGLGADAFNDKAVKKIFLAKGRPSDNPMIVHISKMEQLWSVAENIPNEAYDLTEKFWPGPLTLVFEKNPCISKIVTAKLSTVAIRMPSNKTALKLIELCGPIAAPSANISGKPSPTKSKHVVLDLNGKVDAIITGADVEIGLESTVLDLTEEPFVILRPGKITFEDLEKFLGKGKVVNFDSELKTNKSPGVKYEHYSPKAKVVLCENNTIKDYILNTKFTSEIIIVSNTKIGDFEFVRKDFIYHSKEELAKNIFDWFRKVDSLGVKTIVVQGVDEAGIGCAVMNRIRKAANEIIK